MSWPDRPSLRAAHKPNVAHLRPYRNVLVRRSMPAGRVLPWVNHRTRQLCSARERAYRHLTLLLSLHAVGNSTPSLTGYIFCIPFP
jgi:hypothetical protein